MWLLLFLAISVVNIVSLSLMVAFEVPVVNLDGLGDKLFFAV